MKRMTVMTVMTVALLSTGCGSDDTATGNGPTVTDPSTTPEVSSPAPGLPTNDVVVDDGGFTSVKEMADEAAVVVVGTVTGHQSLGRPQPGEGPLNDEYLGLTISVDDVLKGESVDEVSLAWDAYVVDASGQRTAANVLNGVPVPQVGDQLVLFLRPADAQFAALLGGFPTHAPVALDGIGFVDDGVVTVTDNSSAESAVLPGLTIEQVVASL